MSDAPDSPSGVYVGVDFTGDRLRLIMSAPEGKTLLREEWPLPVLEDEDAWSWEVGGRIAAMFARERGRRFALAIGVAAPGPVDPVTGELLRSVDGQPSWAGLAVVDSLRRHIGVPVVAEHRVIAALQSERWHGAAQGHDDAMYVTLRGIPVAAVLSAGRILRGARFEAGSLPAVPELDPEQRATGRSLETAAGLLADAIALVDPEVVVVDGTPAQVEPLLPLLQRVVDEVAPGPRVVPAELGERAALLGAVSLATTVAFEGEREA